MGFDVTFGPADGFQEWTTEQWDDYAAGDLDGDTLGSYTSVGGLLETVRMTLEHDDAGSRFPLVTRLSDAEAKGWYHSELPKLLEELATIRAELAQVALEDLHFMSVSSAGITIGKGTDSDIADARRDFASVYPDRELSNAADFHHYFLDTLSRLAQRALSDGRGLVIQ